MTIIENNWKNLAQAIIEQAFYDIKYQGNNRRVPYSAVKTAEDFLDNSKELEALADMCGMRGVLTDSGNLEEL